MSCNWCGEDKGGVEAVVPGIQGLARARWLVAMLRRCIMALPGVAHTIPMGLATARGLGTGSWIGCLVVAKSELGHAPQEFEKDSRLGQGF